MKRPKVSTSQLKSFHETQDINQQAMTGFGLDETLVFRDENKTKTVLQKQQLPDGHFT